MKKISVIFISSTGGHLSEMLELKDMFKKYDYHIITEKTKSNTSLIKKYPNRVDFLLYGNKHNLLLYPCVVIANSIKSLIYYLKYRPKYIITTGAHTAAPMCLIGNFFGSKIIFIETFANVESKTMTGKYVYRFADKFIVQWPKMKKLYPKAEYNGWIY